MYKPHFPLKLTHKIYAGYLLTALITTALSWFSFVVFDNLSKNFTRFIGFSSSARLDLELARDVSEIQRQALIYTHEGHPSAVQRVEELYTHMSRLIKLEREDHEHDDLKTIGEHLDNYMQAFRQLQKQHDLQHRLVHYDIREHTSEAERQLRHYMALTTDRRGVQAQVRDQQLLNTLLLVEKNAMRYFDMLDPIYIIKAKRNLSIVRISLQTMIDLGGEQQHLTYLKQAVTEARLSEQVFLEAVQRTRAYLFLVNVVMSAEAYEIIYHASRISRHIQQDMGAVEQSTFAVLDQASKGMILGILLSLLLVLLLSLMIGRSITRPIKELTTAFEALSHGSGQTEIPAYRVHDEIGQLTAAANVFRDKNRETEQLLNDLAVKKGELERSNDEMEQFVYTVSHDLKSPLVTSMGFIGIIRRLAEQGRMDEAIQKLDRIIASNERMGQLINDLLELSRVGRVDLDKTAIDLNQLLEKLHRTQAHRLQQKGFTMRISPGLPTIYGNESRILQLFENLLGNALKYGQSSEGESLITIEGHKEPDADLIRFSDNGPGIDSKYHEKIFNLFYRLSNESEGTGIGLAVAAKVMKFHQGSIWVESIPGKGASFCLRFGRRSHSGEEPGNA